MSGFSVDEWKLGVGVNVTWDLIKSVYSRIKSDFDRRISPQDQEFAFDWLDTIVASAMDILAGTGTNRISKANNVLHQWLVNVPEEFSRREVRAWLTDPAVRQEANALM